LSTLQSKAAKRRDGVQNQPRAPKKKTSAQNSLTKANGFTGMTGNARASERSRLGDQMELEVIQVDSLPTPQRKRVSFLKISSLILIY